MEYYVVVRLNGDKTYYAAEPDLWVDDVEQALQFHREKDAERFGCVCGAPREVFVLKMEETT